MSPKNHLVLGLAGSLLFNAADTKDGPLTGTVNQNGYRFDYQSSLQMNLRMYRVRNSPAGVSTPVKWGSKDEVFLDVEIPKCPKDAKECEWVTATITTIQADRGKTILGYGVNGDSYKNYPAAYLCKSEAGAMGEKKEYPTLTSTLTGEIVVADMRTAHVDLAVSSSVNKVEGGWHYTYRIKVGKKGSSMAMKQGQPGIRVEWEAAKSDDYTFELKRTPARVIEPGGEGVRIHFSKKGKMRVVKKRLLLYDGGKKVASMAAPAYVPAE